MFLKDRIDSPSSPDAPIATPANPSEEVKTSTAVASVSKQEDSRAELLTQSQRLPVLIPATGKKSAGTMRSPQGRRLVISIGTAIVLILILFGALATVLPTENGRPNGLLGMFQPQIHVVTSSQNTTALIAAQAATATAVTQDGFDAGGNVTYADVNQNYALGNGQTTLDIAAGGALSPDAAAGGKVSAADLVIRAMRGQCTYWAQWRYWQLTGYEVPWSGNAATYASSAPLYYWINTSTPVLHSIIVLQPGVQHAGAVTGHVGIVEAINPDGSVYVSAWNQYAPGQLTYYTYTPGYGVSFVYHP